MSHISEGVARSFWGNSDCDFSYSESDGMSGGILTLWNSSTVSVVMSFRGSGYIGIKMFRAKGKNIVGLVRMENPREDWDPKPFKFNNEWFHNKDFMRFVEEEWKEIYVSVEEGIRDLNEADDCDDVSNEVQAIKRKASSRLWLNLKIKENMLIQKSRVKWLNDGDSNSKFFHRVMKERRRRNHLGSISTSSGILANVEEVKDGVWRHFNEKFKEVCESRPVLENGSFNTLSMEDSASLELPFSEEEIKEAVSNCDGAKSPGPDGFTLLFVKNVGLS
ncbi:uncharacterized protein LOC131650503 [Vicia villosa]|uniref:uncharacterized protein LOC131650503 n=1 Tax=Vicia villosa TaxID=3911 RepID=UPI00273C3EBA|nr:uncharacterized protein LOC131650503 [Vicia villosa]